MNTLSLRLRSSNLASLVLLGFALSWGVVNAQAGSSTRVTDPGMHARTGERNYPYRAKSEYVLRELDLRAGDVVVDIGAGDGWWSERFAKAVGGDGIVHAAEVDTKKVEDMRGKLASLPQVRPYLSKTDGTGLPEKSCDLAFLSQTYHHLDLEHRVEYLRRLRSVMKPTGRLAVIEEYPITDPAAKKHATALSVLVKESEEAGWILARCELMAGTYHYLAIFVQKDLFPPEPATGRRLRV